MSTYQAQTDQAHQITLPSAIEQVLWTRRRCAPGGTVGLEVLTAYVGNGADMQIKLSDERGREHGVFKDKIYANHFWATITVPSEARDALYAEVKLPRHGLQQTSKPLQLTPVISITHAQWSQPSARRDEVLTLTADVEGAPDGTEAEITIFEHDADGAHDLITTFPVLVQGRRVEAEWEFEYHEDTDDIPTAEESERGYNPPEYFFRVSLGGVSAESPLLEFKDWIDIEVVDETGVPMPEKRYVIHLPDGQELRGETDEEGRLRREDMPPGRWWLEVLEEE